MKTSVGRERENIGAVFDIKFLVTEIDVSAKFIQIGGWLLLTMGGPRKEQQFAAD